jgi:PIN domain nuclease of toxin-antitoxin system
MGSHAVILLDTHVVVWSATDDPRLGKRARALIADCGQTSPFYVSAISAWEIAMLVRKGRLDLGEPAQAWFTTASRHPAWQTVLLDVSTAMEAVNLPGDFHGDPADRFLVGTARRNGLAFMTADSAILTYAGAGHLKAISAAR